MSRTGRPKVHEHLTRDSVARAALELVDERGADALTMRELATRMGVGAATLYHYVSGREEIVADVVGILLDEVDTRERKEERWDETLRRGTRSLRAMALRHPRAFPLVAAASVDRPPVSDYSARVLALHSNQGIPTESLARMWSTVDAFVTGFLLFSCTSVVEGDAAHADEEPGPHLVRRVDATSEQAFDYGLDVVLAGLIALDPGLAARASSQRPR